MLFMGSFIVGCSPYKGVQNMAYKQINSYLKDLKDDGAADTEIEGDNYFAGFVNSDSSLPKDFRKSYLQKLFRDWSVDSIEETEDAQVAVVTLSSTDVSFMDSDHLRSTLFGEFVDQILTLQSENPDMSDEEIQAALVENAYDLLEQKLDEAQEVELKLIFTCSKEDGTIQSVTLSE